MYSGNGKVIEAQKTGTKIREHSDWKWAGEARRYLDEKDIGTTTDTGTNNNNNNGTTTTTEEVITSTNPSQFDKLSNAIGQVFIGYTNSALYGDEYKGIDWDVVNGITRTLKTTTVDNDNNNNNTGSNGTTTVAKDLNDAIAQKATEMIIRNESGGDYSSCNNDVNASTGASISPSVGIMQWRYEKAKRIMKEMYAKLPNDSDAKYFAEWNWNSDSPWSSSQRSRLKNYLQKNHAITKTIQDNLAKEHVADTLVATVNKYSDRLENPSAKVFMAEIGNTGPDYINRYLKKYKGPKSDFQGFYNDFMKNSYWGPRSIYKNRLTKSYNELKNWTPKYAGKGPDEEEEDLPIVTRFDDGVAPEIPEINAGKGPETKVINKPSNIKKVLPMIGKGADEEESPIVTSFEDDIPEIPEINAGKGPETKIINKPSNIKKSSPIIGKGPEKESPIVTRFDDGVAPEIPEINAGKGPETKINSKSSDIKKSLPIIGKGPADELVNKLIDNKNTISGSNSLIGGKGPIVNKPSIVSVLDNNTKKPLVSEDEPEERIINTPGFKKTEPTDIERLIKQNVVTASELKAANSNFGMGSDMDVSKLIKTPEPESTTAVDVSADISSVDTPSQNQAMKKAIRNSSMSNSRSQELLERAVNVLSSIGVNTFETAKAVKKFNEKEISFNVVNKGQGEVSGNNNIIIPNKPAGNVNVMQQHKNDSSKKSNLNRAMAIARGIF